MCVCLEGEQGIGASHTGPGNERVDIDGGSLYDFVQTPAGVTGTKTITLSASGAGGGGFMVALRPAPENPNIPITNVYQEMTKIAR
jgi:hypothetical protein